LRPFLALLLHETRLLFTWALPLAAAVSTAILILGLESESPSILPLLKTEPDLALAMTDRLVMRVVELVTPIIGVFAMGHAASLDAESGTSELVRSLPHWTPGVVLRRAGAGVLMLTLSLVLTLLMGHLLASLEFSLDRPFLCLPPSVFVGGLALAVSTSARSYVAGVVTALGFWLMDVVRPGVCTGPLYLFQAGQPLRTLDLELNRLLLCAGAGLLAALASWLYSRRGI